MTARTDDTLFDLYRSVGMETALLLEERFTDAELGLVAQSANRPDYPMVN